MSTPIRLLLHFALNILLMWLLVTYLPQYLTIGGGIIAILIIAAVVTLMNIIIRPLLAILTFPLKLFGILLAAIALNGAFMWLLGQVTLRIDTSIALLQINGGWKGWVIVAVLIGLVNWVVKHLPKSESRNA